MTVLELREFLDQLPDDAHVLIEMDGETAITACVEGSTIEDMIRYEDQDDDDVERVLVLRPCNCHTEGEVVADTEAFVMN